MATVAQLKQIIEKNKAGQYWDDYGPFKIGTDTVCEIWTIGKLRRNAATVKDQEGPVKDPEIRFSLKGKGGEEKYFECFGDLAVYLNEQFESAARRVAPVELAKTCVAGIVFIIAAVALAWALVSNVNNAVSYAVVAALGGLAASGAIMFFGVWQPITLPGQTESNGQNNP